MTSAAGGEKSSDAGQPDEQGAPRVHTTMLCVHVRVDHT
jgi:hypothetical protein